MRRVSEHDEARLLVRRITALATPGDERCGIDDKHKEAVALYVNTWIMPLAKRHLDRATARRATRRARRGAP